MQTDCSHFFLTDTATRIWKSNDTAGQVKMFTCLSNHYKESYFSRVVFKNAKIPVAGIELLAEEAFIKTWEVFCHKGRNGSLQIAYKEYPSYLFGIFKNIFLGLLAKEELQCDAQYEFGKKQEGISNEENESPAETMFFSPRTQQVLNQLSPTCQEIAYLAAY